MKRFSVFSLFIMLISAVLFIVEKNNTATDSAYSNELASTSKVAPAIIKSTTPVATTTLLSESSKSQAITVPKESIQAANKRMQDEAIADNWRDIHTRVSTTDEYSSYDLATLKQLAFNGDEKAMKQAAYFYAHEGGDAARISFYQEAAIHGSIIALEMTSLCAQRNATFATDPEEKKKFAIEALVFGEVAAKRGDRSQKIVFGESHYEKDNILFSNSDRDLIKERAQTTYDELQKKRNDLGLGLFDNSVPDVVTKEDNALDEVLNKTKTN